MTFHINLIHESLNLFINYDLEDLLTVPEVEDPCYQAIQDNREEQWDDIKNGKVDEVDGQVELPLHSVATQHMSILTDLNVTHYYNMM